MAQRFRGEWTHQVDGKGRVSIPAPFRRGLEAGIEGYKDGDTVRFTIVSGSDKQNYLEAYSEQEMEQIEELIYSLPRFSREREAISRLIASRSNDVSLDGNGRMILSAAMREKAGISTNAVFAGMIDRFQIWEPEAYAKHNANLSEWITEARPPDDVFEMLMAAQRKYAE